MNHYKPYPKYKDSGIEWTGQVPEYWKIAQLKRLLSINNGSDYKTIEADDGFPVYGSGGAFTYAADYIYDGESVLLGRKGTIDKPLYVNEKFWAVDTMYWTKIMPNANGKFCYYIATTIPFDYYATNTALPSMTQTDLGSHVVAFPDKNEQAVISTFLNKETTRIDTLITKKTRFIELLKEKRQALITHAVTKGLNPEVKMKDSGVEWIGQVPEHWKVVPLKAIAEVLNGATPSSSVQEYWDGDIAWYTPTDIDNEIVKELGAPKRYITKTGFDSCAVRLAPADSVILSTRAPIGSIGIAKVPSTINQGCRTLVPSKGIPAKYLASILVANRAELQIRGNGTTFQELSTEALKSLRVAIPDTNEIISITKHIDQETTRIDTLIRKTQQSIELLKERRSAFITAAVTGQIDLRGEQL